jgi:hypothetical protein
MGEQLSRYVATKVGLGCRRRRRGPKVGQERGQAAEPTAPKRTTRRGRSTPPRGAELDTCW